MSDLTPAITTEKTDHPGACHSCGARNYQAFTKPVDTDNLFEVAFGTGHRTIMMLCAPCLQVLAQSIHPHRTGS